MLSLPFRVRELVEARVRLELRLLAAPLELLLRVVPAFRARLALAVPERERLAAVRELPPALPRADDVPADDALRVPVLRALPVRPPAFFRDVAVVRRPRDRGAGSCSACLSRATNLLKRLRRPLVVSP